MEARRPSVLFVNQHYWPDFASTGQHLTDLTEHLAADGFDVHVLTSRGRYLAGKLESPLEEIRNGVSIHRAKATHFGRGSHLGRLADYATFYARVFKRLLSGPRYDLVVVLTTPPLLSAAAALAHRLRGLPYAVWSMDLHPDAEFALGMLRPKSPAGRILEALNRWGYRQADLVVDLGQCMKARLRQKGVMEDRLRTVPVWSRADEVLPVPHAENPLRQELGLDGKFVVMYSGNAGLAHRFDEVLGAMELLREHEAIEFVFVGGGPRRAEIEAAIAERGLKNARYLDYFPREQLRYSLPLGDVHLLTLREDMAGIAVPGKLYGVMAAGRPLLMVGPKGAESARTIERERIGAVVEPSHPAGARCLANHILALYADPEEARRAGDRARAAFLAHYEQSVACAQWSDLLAERLTVPGREVVGGKAVKVSVPQ
jgi:colanic acid biosynthesis glycosyl transferase WcaI